MEHSYYYLDENNQQAGPLSWNELQALHLPGSTLVWHEGLPSWVRLSVLAAKSSPRKGFFRNLTPLRILLLAYAVLGTLLMLAVGRFIFAFLAAQGYGSPEHASWIVSLLATIVFIPFLFIRRRRHVVHAALALFPLWMGGLASGVYYSFLCDTYGYTLNGYCCIKKPFQDWGVINRWGMETVPCIYDRVAFDGYSTPTYCHVFSGGKAGVCDMDGNVMLPCEWGKVIFDKDSHLFRVADEHDIWGLLDEDGSPLLPCKYDRISDWSGNSDLLEVEKGDWFGLFRPADGTWALQCLYIRTNFNDDGYAKLNAEGYVDSENHICGGRWGVLSRKGEMIVPCIYDSVTFDDDEVRGKLNGIIYCYDYRGNVLGVY